MAILVDFIHLKYLAHHRNNVSSLIFRKPIKPISGNAKQTDSRSHLDGVTVAINW